MNRFLDNCKKLQKRANKGPEMLILGYFLKKNHFWSILVNFEPTKKFKIKKKCFENLKNLKNWAQKC